MYILGALVDLSIVALLGRLGIIINLFLAAFNLIPYGPLDGKTVISWSKPVWFVTFAGSVVLTVLSVLTLGLSFQA